MPQGRQRIVFRRDTAANWTAVNPVLVAGEAGIEIDTNQLKIGDGVTPWIELAYLGGFLRNLQDVDATQRIEGSLLVYNSSSAKFVADDVNTKITLTDGGNF
jgi:hypothetical protein